MSRYQISTNTHLTDSEEVEEIDIGSGADLNGIVKGMIAEAFEDQVRTEEWHLKWLKDHGYRSSVEIIPLSVFGYIHGPNDTLLKQLTPCHVVNLTLEYKIKKPVQEGVYVTIHSIRVHEELAYRCSGVSDDIKGVIYTGKINDIVQFFKEYLFKLSQGD